MALGRLRGGVASFTAGYSPDEERPLGTYATLTGIFLAAFTSALAAARLGGKELPERFAAADVVLLGLATHKLSRIITKDKVTSFARAPFTRFLEPGGQGEVHEEARGKGLRLAIGELLGCPYCLAQWVVAALAVSLLVAPRLTRLIAAMYAAQTLSDFLQLAYLLAKESVS